MNKGRVKWFRKNLGYGFIAGPQQEEVFVHYSAIVGEGHRFLKKGQMVKFEFESGQLGLKATKVEIAK